MTTLLAANPIHSLQIVRIANEVLAWRLEACGIFTGGFITKEDPAAFGCKSLKLHSAKGNLVIPGKMAYHIHVATATGALPDFHLAELAEGASATITMIEKEEHALFKLGELGLAENLEVVLLRKLPHMEYRLLIDKRRRMRVTEAIAAGILGKINGTIRQFSFAKRNKSFLITDIAQEAAICNFLKQNGLVPGAEIVLEVIEPGENIAIDSQQDVVFYPANGAKLSVSKETASQIMVEEV